MLKLNQRRAVRNFTLPDILLNYVNFCEISVRRLFGELPMFVKYVVVEFIELDNKKYFPQKKIQSEDLFS